ncbi:hypothetical protein, conserved [Leishmania lindenbergi]|uniref:Leucine-rich repeat protein n=1 Tax=Leishmania lindenbergi TaxID=651832 RepID=A0AAW3AH90_9TRYP
MEGPRPMRLTCHTTLAPFIAKEENNQVLRIFSAPTRCAQCEGDNRVVGPHRRLGLVKGTSPSAIDFDPLRCIKRITTETMTNTDAEMIAYPMHTHATSFKQLLASLIARLQQTVQSVSWNTPQERPEWNTDLRFYGPWWLVVRSGLQFREVCDSRSFTLEIQEGASFPAKVEYTATTYPRSDLLFTVHEGKPENRYAPLLVERSIAAESRLFADIALRLGGSTFQLNLFHLSGVFVGPDRMHVLVFDGFRRLCTAAARAPPSDLMNDEDHLLSTLSFSSCHLGSAGLLILLAGIVYLSTHHDCHVHSLDLSYNDLTKTSLLCLTQTLHFTKIRRLSLRGNVLTSSDPSTLRELLLEACDVAMEELDLSYTALSVAQVSALIDSLQCLSNLRVLLLEEVMIPSAKWPALVRAVETMDLWHVQLFADPTSPMMTGYTTIIEEMCLRNRQRAMDCSRSEASQWNATTFFGIKNSGFFTEFFQHSRRRGALACREAMAGLPDEYSAYTNNDPSLQV